MQIHKIAAFTEHGRGGNPAGVVLADTLPSSTEMQGIAAEVGYSETAFAALSGESWTTRYFSPESEVPFCGHATIALGAVLAAEKGDGRYRLSLRTGEIEVEARMNNGTARATLRSLPTQSQPASETLIEDALQLLNYSRADLDKNLPVMRMNAGAEHLFLALTSRADLARMQYELDAGRSFMKQHRLVTITLAYRENDRVFHVRNAFASGGVLEDPATGAAAAALAGMLRDQDMLSSGDLIIHQGADMGRPSRIEVRFDDVKGSPVLVSGDAATLS
ncbi:PhzF family phenazine biosynthesis protein [Pseudotabrizicola sp. 4114]|uniref:PhzF family phenazine biosynthesis protein n=1 Tax=Pseudotabrizicola sp. 4114 TaxID=2817731 RepID=UPI002862913B|nr:PhzF family phenazine biosynthesis protein [Pseudorhodobacter sp. 4114]